MPEGIAFPEAARQPAPLTLTHPVPASVAPAHPLPLSRIPLSGLCPTAYPHPSSPPHCSFSVTRRPSPTPRHSVLDA
jgi:hypothetical protein